MLSRPPFFRSGQSALSWPCGLPVGDRAVGSEGFRNPRALIVGVGKLFVDDDPEPRSGWQADRTVRLDSGPIGGELAHPVVMLVRSDEHTSELQSLMRISYAVFCLKKNIY